MDDSKVSAAIAALESIIHDEYDGTSLLAGNLAHIDVLRAALAQSTQGESSPEDRFEQYVATLIDKNPNVRELGERLALWLDEDQFNNVEPVLLGIAKALHAERARVPAEPLRIFSPGEWKYVETDQTFSARDLDEAAFVEYRGWLAAAPSQPVEGE